MKQVGVVIWLLVTLGFCEDPLSGQYTVTPDPQTALTLGVCVDLVMFEPLKQFSLVGHHKGD